MYKSIKFFCPECGSIIFPETHWDATPEEKECHQGVCLNLTCPRKHSQWRFYVDEFGVTINAMLVV